MGRLTPQEFLERLPSIFAENEASTIYLTLKRIPPTKKSKDVVPESIPLDNLVYVDDKHAYDTIVRLKCKKIDIATAVSDPSFFEQYTEVLRPLMSAGLRKKVKKSKSKDVEKKKRLQMHAKEKENKSKSKQTATDKTTTSNNVAKKSTPVAKPGSLVNKSTIKTKKAKGKTIAKV